MPFQIILLAVGVLVARAFFVQASDVGETTTQADRLQAEMGTLSVTAAWEDGTPFKGTVYVDGEEKGAVPLELRVRATYHEVRVVHGTVRRSAKVWVAPCETAILNLTLYNRAVEYRKDQTANLWDLLKKPAYRAAWNRMFQGEPIIGGWLGHFSKTGDGVVSPGKTVMIDGFAYHLVWVCQPHDCGTHLTVLFAPNGKQAWGHYWGHEEFWLNDPDDKKREVFLEADFL